jgi:hypothetical protein
MPRQRTLEISPSFESNLSDVTMESSLRRVLTFSNSNEEAEMSQFLKLKSEKTYKTKIIHFLMCNCIVLSFTLMYQIFKNMKEEEDGDFTLYIFETSFNLGSVCMTFRTIATLSVCSEDDYVSPLEWID